MNKEDVKDLKIVLFRLNQQDAQRTDLEVKIMDKFVEFKKANDREHVAMGKSLGGIKDGLLNPHKGLWALTNRNTAFRLNVTKLLWIALPLVSSGIIFLLYEYLKLSLLSAN